MKFQRDRRSAHTAAFRSQAVPPQRPVAGRRCLNLVQPRPASLRTQYPVRGRCRLSRSQRAPRITAAAHPKVSPGRNPNPARSHHLRIIAIIAAIIVVAIVVGGVAAFLILHGRKNAAAGPVQTSDTTDATPKKTQKQSPTQIEGKKAVSEVTMTNFVCNYDTSDWGGGTAAQWFPT